MEDTPREIVEEVHSSSRRDFLKKSAAAGAVAWSAPAISTLSSKAWADVYKPPKPDKCVCKEEAFALAAKADGIIDGTVGPISKVGDNGGTESVADVSLLDGLVTATLLEAETRECFARATVLNLAIDLDVLDIKLLDISTIEVEVLTAEANGETCEGKSKVVNLRIDGDELTVKTAPNSTVDLPLDLGSIIVNEQNTDGFVEVNALHVFLDVLGLQTLDLIVSHARTTCCPDDKGA